MATVVNLEETVGKTVSNPQPPEDPFVAYARLLDLNRPLRKPLPFPKGAFRFRTHEEADQWRWAYIMKAAKNQGEHAKSEGIPLDPPPPSSSDPLADLPRWARWLIRKLVRK